MDARPFSPIQRWVGGQLYMVGLTVELGKLKYEWYLDLEFLNIVLGTESQISCVRSFIWIWPSGVGYYSDL